MAPSRRGRCRGPRRRTRGVARVAERQAVALDGIIAAFVGGIGGLPVTSEQSTIDGIKVRCFTVGAATAHTGICVANDGIVVTITGPSVTYKLTRRTATVDAGVFTPPK